LRTINVSRFALIAVLILLPLPLVWVFVAARDNKVEPPPPQIPRVSESRVAELREIAIAEVKKREGWTGVASRPTDEGNLYYFYIMRQSPLPRIGIQVEVDCNTGKVVGYDRGPGGSGRRKDEGGGGR
jgi:hypothetical protein